MAYKLPDHLIKRVYELRGEGHSPTHITKKIANEGLGEYALGVLDKHADKPENVERFKKSGHYHPKNIGAINLKPINVDDIFKHRQSGLSDRQISSKMKISHKRLKKTIETNKEHPNYTEENKVERLNPKIKSSIIKTHGTINPDTNEYHTYGTIARLHGVTRNVVAGIIDRSKKGKLSEMSELIYRIKNVLNESNLIKKRKETIERVRQKLEDEGPERRDEHFSSLHRILVDAHNELSKLESQRDIHPDVAKMSKGIRQQLVGHVENIMNGKK